MVVLELPDSADPGQWGVYVLCNRVGEPLYIGQTTDLYARLNNHRRASWWRLVRSLDWTACSGAAEAQIVEREMIAAFETKANTNGHTAIMPGRSVLPDWTAKRVRLMYDAARRDGTYSTADRLFNAYCAALNTAGWPLASIGHPIMLTREAIRLRVQRATQVRSLPQVPPVPPRPPKPVKPKRIIRQAPESVVAEMHALFAIARYVNGGTAADDPRREASERLAEIYAEQFLEGVSIYRLAKQLGITTNAVRSRLAYHGYIEQPPCMTGRSYIGRPRAATPNGECKHGHPFEGDNVRLINGDPKRRTCRACERRRSAEYKARKLAALAAQHLRSPA